MPDATSSRVREFAREAVTPIRLGDHTSSRRNNFDLLRLVAAWLVLVSHSFALTGHDEPLHQFNSSLGNVSVLVFFAISGLLIHRSWDYEPVAGTYWRKRALRLLPGLAVVSMLTAFVLGPLVTTRSMSSYFGSWETWIYPIRVTLQVPFGAQLPGVYDDNPLAGAVNGSLWSLPVEVSAYFILSVLGTIGLLAKPRMVAAVAALSLFGMFVWTLVVPHQLAQLGVIAGFAVGAAAYSYRDRIVLDARWAAVALVVAALASPTALRPVVWTVAITYITFWIAYAVPPFAQWATKYGDASYGIYIYAFPIQQLLIWAIGPEMGPWVLIALATPIVVVLGHLSWRLVERPALKHKPKPRQRTAVTDDVVESAGAAVESPVG